MTCTGTVRNVVATVLAAAMTVGESGEVIYDNTLEGTGSTSFTALQIGDEVQPAGTARVVSELLIGVTQQGFPGTADLQVRLYANDGAGGAPGTMLWESAVMDDVALSGNAELIAFTVPEITVPDVFTWTIQISDTNPVAVGLPHFEPPTVGSSPEYAWFGSPGSWTQLTSPGNRVDFMARVIAIDPCPADVDGDGDVGFADLLAVLSVWGPCPGCPEDVDGDGTVGFADLVTVLSEWGPCP